MRAPMRRLAITARDYLPAPEQRADISQPWAKFFPDEVAPRQQNIRPSASTHDPPAGLAGGRSLPSVAVATATCECPEEEPRDHG